MFNKTEAEERKYLNRIIEKLEDAYFGVDEAITRQAQELKDQKTYMYENKTGMDAAEKAAIKQSVNTGAISGDQAEPVYIGIHAYFDEEENQNLIHDWRAPVLSMFYDYEPGPASFETPSGKKEGEIERKRQFRIKKGRMEMMLESDVYIRNDVLQEELSRSADDKMKNIVATIQRDQNAIIRNESSPPHYPGSCRIGQDIHRPAPHRLFALPFQGDAQLPRYYDPISQQGVFRLYIQRTSRTG